MVSLIGKVASECRTEEEIEAHNGAVMALLERLEDLGDIPCAVIENNGKEQNVHGSSLYGLMDLFSLADTRCGMDLVLDEGKEYLVFVAHGISNDTAFLILPYDERHDFLNIVSWLMGGEVKIARDQKE